VQKLLGSLNVMQRFSTWDMPAIDGGYSKENNFSIIIDLGYAGAKRLRIAYAMQRKL
jgi:hypothetical protein